MPSTAAKRFNQAYLLDPSQSGVYQGFGAVVADRFKDFVYADELFRTAALMKMPSKALSADHGRMLLMAGRAAEAKPLLEAGIRADPDWAVPQANLAWASFWMGDLGAACRLALSVKGRDLQAVAADLLQLKQRAACRSASSDTAAPVTVQAVKSREPCVSGKVFGAGASGFCALN
jgi:Flp pilus assembly protein TadD